MTATAPGTLQDLVASLPRFGRRRAVGLRSKYGTRWWTYRQLYGRAHVFAARLRDLDVGPGDRVVVWAPNSPEWVAAALGTVLRGAVVVPVDADGSAAWARRLTDDVGAVLVVHGRDQDPSGFRVRCCTIDWPPSGLDGEDDDAATAAGEDVVAVAPEDAAVILYTSGSTREPRGVTLTHRNLAAQAETFRRWSRLTRLWTFRLLALSPLSHAQGLMIGMLVPLRLGMSALYTAPVEPQHVLRTIRQNRVHLLLAVPAVQHALAEALRNGPAGKRRRRTHQTLAARASAIRFFPLRRHVLFRATRARLGHSFVVLLVGGATLDPDDEAFWFECGYVLVHGYGLTETSALVSVHINGPFRRRLGPIGRALPNQEVHVAPDGEVWVRGPNVSELALDGDGWFHTGDLADQDVDGQLWFRGRKKDVIVTADGLNVHPGDVEARLRTCAGVRDAVVLEAPGTRPVGIHAVLLLGDGGNAEVAVGEANRSLEPHQQVRSWSVWPEDDLPRTSILKVRRQEVAQAMQNGADGGPAPSDGGTGNGALPTLPSVASIRAEGNRRRRIDLLVSRLSAGGGAEGPGSGPTDASLQELGLGSLDVAELLERVNGRRPGSLDVRQVRASTRLSALEAMVSAPAPPATPSRLPVRQPRWSGALPGRLVRTVSTPLLVGAWSRCAVRLAVERAPAAVRLRGPCIVAAAPHHHWLDSFAVSAALPRRWRPVTVTNRDFSEWFLREPVVGPLERFGVGLAYHLLWPLVFSFVIVPNFGTTQEGLYELGRSIDRGLTPVSFPGGLTPRDERSDRLEPGIAMMAVETGLPVVPVWIEATADFEVWPRWRRPRAVVRVGEPIGTGSATTTADLVTQIEAAFDRLEAGGW